MSRLHELGVLLLEDLEVALGFPVPDGVGGEDEVHFLEGALVGFWVEGPDDDDGGGVDGAEEVEGLFIQGFEDGGKEQDLQLVFALVFECLRGGKKDSTYRPPVANGPSDHAPGVASGTHFQWEDLGRVQPWHGQPCRAEDGGEEEHEENGPAADARGTRAVGFGVDGSTGKAAGTEHADTLAD